ncbi:DUF2637 domain-containing protein [Streptomyces sp. NBC_00439]|uniref:DUF2637 domain-containing protein n=1 Tax=Streptomyces sp. NBC_00439 TaxID=2903650 RepID=UPI0022564BFC|nr:DUF2637 domain-containing protein [Streptomyces sp. NBC_00439]MCX5106984.1 DUF2637 domain-containing protein [Streptomyces sp. NBC_00439]
MYSPDADTDVPHPSAPASEWGSAPAGTATGETAGMQDPMTSTMETGAVSAAGPGISAEAGPVSATGPDVSAEGLAGWLDGTGDTTATRPGRNGGGAPQGSSRLRFWLGVAFLVGGLAVGGIGFYLSFDNLSTAANTRFAFDPGAKSVLFALGVDVTIVVCLVGDLLFAARGHALWLLRPVAHGFTALTIYLNAAAHGSVLDHPGLAVSHAAMPVVFVVLMEAARHYLVMEAALEMGIGRDPIPWHRWLMHPIQTSGIFRTMTTWALTYTQVRTQRRELAIYEVWLEHREEIEKGLADGKLGVLDRLPVLLAPHGVPVDEALALPARMRRAEQQRTQKQEREKQELKAAADRHARELEHQADLEATAAETERLEAAGQLAQLRARITGQEKVAVAEAEGATAAAEFQSQVAITAARRAATLEERRAAQEEEAEESARTAEAKRRAAEDDLAAAEATRRTAEEVAKTALAEAEKQRGKAELAQEQQREAAAAKAEAADRKEAADLAEMAAEAQARAAETAERAAETRARAARAEALANMSTVQIKTRVVARLLLAHPGADGAEIAAALGGASPATASTYKTAAVKLIAQGYPDVDPDLTGESATAAALSIPGQTEITA